jgi:hypothetical protein
MKPEEHSSGFIALRLLYPRASAPFHGSACSWYECHRRVIAVLLSERLMKIMPTVLSILLSLIALPALAQTAAPATQPSAEQEQLIRKLEQTLSNATLVGGATFDGQNKPPKEDRYSLGEVKKLGGDMWLIPARIGNGQATIPLVLPIKWAGDTPVITVTDMGLPGMGKYTARVIFYGDHYAGTWSAGPTHGGTLFGRIEHGPTTQPSAKE